MPVRSLRSNLAEWGCRPVSRAGSSRLSQSAPFFFAGKLSLVPLFRGFAQIRARLRTCISSGNSGRRDRLFGLSLNSSDGSFPLAKPGSNANGIGARNLRAMRDVKFPADFFGRCRNLPSLVHHSEPLEAVRERHRGSVFSVDFDDVVLGVAKEQSAVAPVRQIGWPS